MSARAVSARTGAAVPDCAAVLPPVVRSPVPAWLLKLLAVPAAVAVWSGWVGVGQMTGFGMVRPLPGIWSSLQVDTAFTLPVGIEAYAVLSMRAWLTRTTWVRARTRRFAAWSALGSLVLGMAGSGPREHAGQYLILVGRIGYVLSSIEQAVADGVP